MNYKSWKDRKEDFVWELKRLSNMLSTDETNTPQTFVNVLRIVFDCEFLSEDVFCKKFGLTSEGLKMWMSRSEKQEPYYPSEMSRLQVFTFIYKEMTKPT